MTPVDSFKSLLALAEEESDPKVRAGMFRAVAHIAVGYAEGMLAEIMTGADDELLDGGLN